MSGDQTPEFIPVIHVDGVTKLVNDRISHEVGGEKKQFGV